MIRRNTIRLLMSMTIVSAIALILTVHGQAWFGDADKPTATSESPVPAESTASINDSLNQPFTFGTFRQIARDESSCVVNIATSTVTKPRAMPRGYRSPFEDFFDDESFRHFFGPRNEQRVQSLGSGVIIDSEGYVLTNNHVIEDVDEIQVNTLDGKTYDAKVVGTDSQTDIALIRFEPEEPVHAVPIGDSDTIEVGDWVMAIGNPFGFGHTVTVGVVSAKGRSYVMPTQELPYQDFIQTDASINPGNSGGPLLDIRGNLIGINAVIASRTGQSAGIGFAIPINMIKSLLPDLKEKGTVTRGWLGVSIQTLDENLSQSMGLKSNKGALISEIVADGPADRAGLLVGDVVVRFDKTDIKDSSHLSLTVASTPVGTNSTLVIIRDGKEKSFQVELGERPQDLNDVKTSKGEVVDLGMTVQDITPDIARQLDNNVEQGVVIAEIAPNSAADRAGLRRGDVILEVNQKKVKSVKDYREIVASKTDQGLVLYVQRGNSKIFVAIRSPKENAK